MREIKRLPEPQILIDKKQEWLDKLLASGAKRPDSSKYAHIEVKTQLNSMSFHKCFYCEMKLKGQPKEIDHHIEVSVDKNLSFEWTNLYLACDNCNGKIPHSTIAITDTLDPCIDSDDKIKEHITFNKEYIEAKNNSPLGLRTIQKYRLEKELLDDRRRKQLQNFFELLIEIKENQIKENGRGMTTEEKNAIHRFKQKDHSFSLMFELLIEKYDL